ncbi:YfhO family protein [bacterium]|nr:YfhO family protein [bacterium]
MILLYCIGLVCIYGRTLFPSAESFIAGIDVRLYFYYHAFFIKENLLAGQLPLWNPYYYCGHPFLANPQTFVFYPVTLLYALFSLPLAFNYDVIIHVFIAGIGMMCFVRYLTDSRPAALASSIIFSFNGYFMDKIHAGHLTMIHTAALMPWILYCLERFIRTRRIGSLLATGSVFGLQILGGEPQNSYYTALMIVLYIITRSATLLKTESKKSVFRMLFKSLLIPMVACGLSAVQLLPSLEFVLLSDRSSHSFEFATLMSFGPEFFLRFLIPTPTPLMGYDYWEMSCYLGVLAIMLILVGLLFSRDRHLVFCFALISLFAITVLTGKYSPLYHAYFSCLPGISFFRIPARCLILLVLSASVLAGLGVQYLLEKPLSRKHYLGIQCGFLVLLLCLFPATRIFSLSLFSHDIVMAALWITGAFITFFCVYRINSCQWKSALIVLFLYCNLAITYSATIPLINENNLTRPTPVEQYFLDNPGFDRVGSGIDSIRGMMFHCFFINGYSPIVLADYFHFIHEMADLPVPIRKFTLSPALFDEELVFSSRILGLKYAVVRTLDGHKIASSPVVIPRFYLVPEMQIISDRETQKRVLKDPNFRLEQSVILDSQPETFAFKHELTVQPVKENGIVVTDYGPNRIMLDTTNSRYSFLVVNDLYYPGWVSWVDDEKQPVLRANFIMRAVPVPPGQHIVSLVYRPYSFQLGAALTLLTLCFLITFSVVHFRSIAARAFQSTLCLCTFRPV